MVVVKRSNVYLWHRFLGYAVTLTAYLLYIISADGDAGDTAGLTCDLVASIFQLQLQSTPCLPLLLSAPACTAPTFCYVLPAAVPGSSLCYVESITSHAGHMELPGSSVSTVYLYLAFLKLSPQKRFCALQYRLLLS